MILVLCLVVMTAKGQDLYLIDGQRPRKAILTTSPHLENSLLAIESAMTDALGGIMRRYDRKKISKLLGCFSRRQTSEERLPGKAEFYVHLFAQEEDLEARRVLAIAHEPGTGQYLAWDLINAQSIEDAMVINGKKFDRELKTAPLFRGVLDPMSFEDIKGQDIMLGKPYREADLFMDKRTMKERLHGGAINRKRKPAMRNLLSEDIYVRLPMNYDPREPAGLVVWCAAGAGGLIPSVFAPALDALNLICVGVANAGNQRPIGDRVQLMLDARANAIERFHVDPQRIYMTGLSGGGRVTSSMAVCFPEYIRGSVSIVGFSSYETFGQSIGTVGRPPVKWLAMAKDRPFAMISGPDDFNNKEMKGRFGILQREGFRNMKFFDYPDLGHTLPTSEQFTEALQWVDAFYQSQRQQSESRASLEFEGYRKDRIDLAPTTERDRETLIRIIENHPWTETSRASLRLLIPDSELVAWE
ncbi:MAG: hypothetical protein O7G85_16680 [Planctomycetota bacterium]|nr:hypothetical protein [Planctomycetota bacterium]